MNRRSMMLKAFGALIAGVTAAKPVTAKSSAEDVWINVADPAQMKDAFKGVRPPDQRRVFYVDVGKMPAPKQAEFVRRLKTKFQQKRVLKI